MGGAFRCDSVHSTEYSEGGFNRAALMKISRESADKAVREYPVKLLRANFTEGYKDHAGAGSDCTLCRLAIPGLGRVTKLTGKHLTEGVEELFEQKGTKVMKGVGLDLRAVSFGHSWLGADYGTQLLHFVVVLTILADRGHL
jgi:hypothetical protein